MGELRSGAVVVLLRIRSAGVAAIPAPLTRRQGRSGNGARDQAAGSIHYPQKGGADLRTAPRAWLAAWRQSALRREALSSPGAGFVFARARDSAEGVAGQHADHRVLLLRRGRRECEAASETRRVSRSGGASGCLHAGIGGGSCRREVL